MTIRELLEKLMGKNLPAGEDVSIPMFDRDDTHNSCSLNTVTGLWYDHAQNRGGNLVQAVAALAKCDNKGALKIIRDAGIDITARSGGAQSKSKSDPDPIDEAILESYVRNLHASKEAMEMTRKFGWNDETLKIHQIGWDKRTERYAIPIRDVAGKLMNFRLYSPTHKGTEKTINFAKGYGRARLYGVDSMKEAMTVAVTEGEKDRLLMCQVIADSGVQKWTAVTGTGGAGTWRSEWNEAFDGKHVLLVYDRDKAGEEAAEKIAQELISVALSVRIIILDISDPPGADVTDYFVVSGKTWDDFKKLVQETEPFRSHRKKQRVTKAEDLKVYSPHLSEASDKQFIGKRLAVQVMVAGKDLAPFAVPRKVQLDCDMKRGKECLSCKMFEMDGSMDVEIPKDDPDIIRMVKVPEAEVNKVIRSREGINMTCRRLEDVVETWHNIEEVTVVPEIDFSEGNREYVTRTGFVPVHGIKPNMSYIARGTSVPHPKTQHVVHLFPEMEEAQDSIDDFTMNEEMMDALKVFRPGEDETVSHKMHGIARDLSTNVTRIYGRDDIVIAVELCYHTVLGFEMQGKAVGKAWGDILVMGDTRTGKSESIEGLMNHYRLGDIALGEDASFAGLVGGLSQQSGGRWSLTWGRIPLNDRRLLVLDEASGLDTMDISKMSGIRSNGIAELTKIVTQRTMARTRMIWVSNPRSNKSMDKHAHGVEAVRELIGRPEDIARYDLVVCAASNEVPVETINAKIHDKVEHVYTGELCRNLILWAWSRRVDQIKISDDVTDFILEIATEHSKKYASGIPLVEGGNHRIKIAKLAVAVACRMFSTEDGNDVIVTREHVQFAADFLDECYEKPSMDYLGWSLNQIQGSVIDPNTEFEAQQWVRNHPDWAGHWLQTERVRLEDFRTLFDLSQEEGRSEIFKPLFRWKLIMRGRGSDYIKTPNFIKILKDVLAEVPATTNGSTPHTPTAAPVAVNEAESTEEDFPF